MALNALLDPTFELPSNAVKSLLFDVSALLLQLTVTRIFSIISYRQNAFTPYLVFSEPLPQQLLYILRRGSFLVLSFILLFHAASLWDTMLWGLDHPGLINRASRVNADTDAKHRRQNPPYAVSSQSTNNIFTDIGTGIWEGVNDTLTGIVVPGNPTIATSPTWSGTEYPGPRIYLDNDGWSVSIDLLKQTVASFGCPETYPDFADVNWECEYDYLNNSRTATDFMLDPFAVPQVWWSSKQGLVEYETIMAERGMNPWEALGSGGDTVMMKMVFSLTRAHRRHTFMVSAMKTTLLALAATKIQMAEVQDLVDRTWRAGDSEALRQHDLDTVGRLLEGGMTGLTMGRQHTDGYKITSRIYMLLAPLSQGVPLYTAFQILDSNLTLVNSETVNIAPTPFEDCDTWYRNDAYGGAVTGSNCYVAERSAEKTTLFQGEADTMAVFVLQRALGKRRAAKSTDALNDDAWRWIQENDDAVESLLLSRAYVIAGNAASVKIDVNVLRPGISLLQMLLTTLPALLLAVSWGTVLGWVGWHYQTSLFMNLVATTHEGYDGENPNTLADVPNVGIVRTGGKVYLGTDRGVFLHSGRDGAWEGEGDWPALERPEEKGHFGDQAPVVYTPVTGQCY